MWTSRWFRIGGSDGEAAMLKVAEMQVCLNL
jgi:hypothetical protein